MDAVNEATGEATAQLIEHSVVGSILVLAILALVFLVYHILKSSYQERERFHADIEVERERSIQTIKDFNEFQSGQRALVDRVVAENEKTRISFQHALDSILNAIKGKM